jgi:hypothetical protein
MWGERERLFEIQQHFNVLLQMNPFTRRSTAAWYPVGLASELPNLDDDGQRVAPKCKAFAIPTNGPVTRVEDIDLPGELKDQVLVFKYKGKYHAIDHVSPVQRLFLNHPAHYL